MDKNVFEPVCAKTGETTKHQFEDSSGKLYRFSGDHSNKENDTPNQSYAEEESVCLMEETRDGSDLEDEVSRTPPEHMRYAWLHCSFKRIYIKMPKALCVNWQSTHSFVN